MTFSTEGIEKEVMFIMNKYDRVWLKGKKTKEPHDTRRTYTNYIIILDLRCTGHLKRFFSVHPVLTSGYIHIYIKVSWFCQITYKTRWKAPVGEFNSITLCMHTHANAHITPRHKQWADTTEGCSYRFKAALKARGTWWIRHWFDLKAVWKPPSVPSAREVNHDWPTTVWRVHSGNCKWTGWTCC